MEKNNEHLIMKVTRNTIIGNSLLTLLKLIAGIWGSSPAMLSDAVHTLSDVISTVIVIIGVKLAHQAPDKEHPYGHERFECVAAIILAVILAATGAGIGYGGFRALRPEHYGTSASPGVIALAAAVISILFKEAMYWYTRAAANATNSGSLMADAWHHRSDALSSVGSFIGILGARLGFPALDPAACLIISLFIMKAALDIFKDAVKKVIDHACDDEITEQIRALILNQEDVLDIDKIKTRMFGNKIYVDVEIRADGNKSLSASHTIAHSVHDSVEEMFPFVKHCMVHVNPGGTGEKAAPGDNCGSGADVIRS